MSAEAVPLPGRPGPVGLAQAALDAVQALLAGADATFAIGWAHEERTGVIAALDRVVDLATVYRARVLAAHQEDGRWACTGDRSFAGHRARTGRIGIGQARAETELGQHLAEAPQAAAAVVAGQVPLAYAAEQTFDAVRARRFARLIDTGGGVKIDAFVDPVVGAAIRTALEAVTPVPAENDTRTPEQRVADALETLATRVLGVGADKTGAQIRPHISLIIPADTWTTIRTRGTAQTGSTGTDRGAGTTGGTGTIGANSGTGTTCAGSGTGADDDGVGPMALPELDDGTPIPPTVLERIACDCEITRIVLDADSIPLDVGRTQRTYSKELRRAILIRDRHCRWPGCTLRATWCDIHHIAWYSRSGPTSAGNALTLCAFHHHEVHRHDITIAATPTGHTFQHRDGHPIGTSDRRHEHHTLTPRTAAPDHRPEPHVDDPPHGRGRPAPPSTPAVNPSQPPAPPPTTELF